MTTNEKELTCNQELDGMPALLLDELKNPDVRLSILKKDGLLGQLIYAQAFEINKHALYDSPEEDGLELFGAPGKDKLELLRILNKDGLLDANLLIQLKS